MGALATSFPELQPAPAGEQGPAVLAAAQFRAAPAVPAGAARAAQAAPGPGPPQRPGPRALLLAPPTGCGPRAQLPADASTRPAPFGFIGMFRAQHETAQPAFAHIRPRTPQELQDISPHAMGLVFCHLRLAETTVPRSEKDDAATITALKAQKYLQTVGMHSGALSGDMHHICYGTQARFTAGLTPHEIAKRLAVAIPFMINDPKDITTTTKWMEIRAHGRVLYTRLEAELAVCRVSGTEHAMGHTVFRLIQKLLAQYLDLSALALIPPHEHRPIQPARRRDHGNRGRIYRSGEHVTRMPQGSHGHD